LSPEADQRAFRLFETMVLVRRFEERVQELFSANELPGFVHLSIGQEAVAAGACEPLRLDDAIVTTHRGHGHILAKGATLDGVFAELFARDGGVCHGVGGSMHLIDAECGVLGANAIVGAGIGIATGAALAFQLEEGDRVAVAFFGEGAVNTGSFHENVNLAAVWDLPVIFLCENNGWAEMSPAAEQSRIVDVAERAAGYGIAAAIVDGNDPESVGDAVAAAVDRARSGGGPTLVECKTFRLVGHYEGDQQRYRPENEVEAWTRFDPMQRMRGKLVDSGVEEAAIEAVLAAANERIERAIAAAREEGPPTIDLLAATYAETVADG
jgi:TPP-dependent pyruvate/acetoin dehydrogenase alpha subunit